MVPVTFTVSSWAIETCHPHSLIDLMPINVISLILDLVHSADERIILCVRPSFPRSIFAT